MHLVRSLKKSLPDYMIPNAFFRVDTFPLTSTGKIDRKILADSNTIELEKNVQYIAPQTDRERQISALWKQVLNVDKVGIHDNFFELGGHSLNLIQLNSELKKVFRTEIPVVSMLRYPTISAFEKYLAEGEFDTIIRRSHEKKQGKRRLSKIRDRKREADVNDAGN
jgi:acyl carrier protein